MRRLWLALGASLVTLFVVARAPRAHTLGGEGDAPGVPRRFRGLYHELSEVLDRFDSFLETRPARRRGGVVFGGEILPANAHRGEGLLDDRGAFPGSLIFIDHLKELGAGGVSLSMAYPILTDDYPRSAEYWAFYKRLAREIRSRGLKVHVKSGPLFTEKEFTSVRTDYSKVTVESYFRDRMRMDQRIAEEIRPDYLSIGNEPTSEMQILKIKITSDRYRQFIADTLRGMKRSGVLVGAGSGNWDNTDYIKRFANDTDLDFIDIHIYPLASSGEDYLRRAVEMAKIARAGRKRIIIGEAWLYKASPRELKANPTAVSVFARDVYSFWAPLDSRFLEMLAKMAQAEEIEYVSPFWTKYLFGYVEFGKAGLFPSAKQMTALADKHMVEQLLAGKYSATGEAYRRIARANR